jgi:sugar O-acyltransferase (sialic acid O-acetyltransferase NeuD family)
MLENRKILVLGAGGHCKSVLDSLLSMSYYETVALIDKDKSTRIEQDKEAQRLDALLGYSIIGGDHDLERLFFEGYTDAFVAVGSIGDVSLRMKLYALIKQIGFHIPNIIDISSVVSPYAFLGEGIFIGKNAVVNAESRIGNCAIINTSSIIEHECFIGDFVHVASGSVLSGNVHIDKGTHIGAGCTIRQGIHIGEDTMIGMGSVVLRDFGKNVTAYGNPCREVKHE